MASVKFYLRRYRSDIYNPQNVEVSVIAKFTVDRRNRFEITLDEKIAPRYWSRKDQCVRGTYRGHLEVNEYLSEVKFKLLSLYRENREMPFAEFKALALKRPEEEKKTLFVAYDKFLDAYRNEKDSKTVSKYTTLLIRLSHFEKVYPYDLATMDFNFYDAFKKFLYRIPNPFYARCILTRNYDGSWDLLEGDQGEPVGIFDDMVYSYLIQLKTFLGWAEKRGYQVHQSYKLWQIIRRVHPPISLTSSELERLECVTLSKALEIARDYLVFECRTGQRISDIKRFDLKDLHDDKWTFTPRKGNRLNAKQITVHFKGYCAPALDILHKYNWKIPIISEQKLNDNIKRACKEAGIDSETVVYRYAGEKRIKISGPKYEFISSHVGRKTMITLALQAGMPVEYIMALTGITEYKTIKHYKAKFEDSAIEQELEKIPMMRKAL
ncbi:MAG TPA: hypothetical protein VK589_20065 [Chryseolinea sp.]|nr:hypothetical protein [Chryseolinea sp.]